MRTGSPGAALRRLVRPQVLGGLGALAMAAVVYSQFNFYHRLERDASIYVYGGQRVLHGVPPYASIMDPKGPMAGILSGFGAGVARLLGHNDVLVIRAEFCAISILGVLGLYLLVLDLWKSVVGALVAAAAFVSFRAFGSDSVYGPDGHTPAVVFSIFAMWLTVRRQWYLAGVAASLAFFTWQPLFTYPVIVLLCAVVWSPGHRLRAAFWSITGGLTPFVGLVIYYAATGYLPKLFEGTFVFPVAGTYRIPMTFGARMRLLFTSLPSAFPGSVALLYAGLVLLVVLAVRSVVSAGAERRCAATGPLVLLMLLGLVVQIAYIVYDYIGWTHALPLLPYAAAGIGGGCAWVLERMDLANRACRIAVAGFVTVSVALTAVCAVAYYKPSDSYLMRGEMASACAIQSSLVPHTALWVIDDPLPLVFLHRANPDNYAYVGGGLAAWRVKHTPGGFEGWMRAITSRASIVVVDSWREAIPLRSEVGAWLRDHGYLPGFIGRWRVYVTERAHARMLSRMIRLDRMRQDYPLTTTLETYRVTHCPRTAHA